MGRRSTPPSTSGNEVAFHGPARRDADALNRGRHAPRGGRDRSVLSARTEFRSRQRPDIQPDIARAGCVVYRFGSPGEADTNAAQLEAVNAHGARVLFGAARVPCRRGRGSRTGRCVWQAGRW